MAHVYEKSHLNRTSKESINLIKLNYFLYSFNELFLKAIITSLSEYLYLLRNSSVVLVCLTKIVGQKIVLIGHRNNWGKIGSQK